MSNELNETTATETTETHQPNPQAYLGDKVVNTDYISAMISTLPQDTKVPHTKFTIGSTLTFNANDNAETQVVVVGYSVNPKGVILDLAFRLSDNVFVIADGVFYSPLPSDSEKETTNEE
jgi:hypothetical protein